MLRLRYKRHWQLASIALLLAVTIAASTPAAIWFWSRDGLEMDWAGNGDKWVHGLAFAVLAVWFAGQYERRWYWGIALGLFAFGALIELLQSFLSYRVADGYDLAANVAGIVSGLLIAWTVLGQWSVHFEDWYDRRRGGTDLD